MPDHFSLLDLGARIERLERQSRNQKRLLLVAVALILSLGMAATTLAQQKTLTFADAAGHTRVAIDATGIKLKDAAGNVRMTLGFNTGDRPAIYLLDAKGHFLWGGYISTGDVPELRIADANDTARAYFGLSADGDPLLQMFGADGKRLVGLEGQKLPFFRLYGASEVERVYLGLSTAGDSVFQLFDASHTMRNFAGVYTTGASGFTAYNSAGTATWSQP